MRRWPLLLPKDFSTTQLVADKSADDKEPIAQTIQVYLSFSANLWFVKTETHEITFGSPTHSSGDMSGGITGMTTGQNKVRQWLQLFIDRIYLRLQNADIILGHDLLSLKVEMLSRSRKFTTEVKKLVLDTLEASVQPVTLECSEQLHLIAQESDPGVEFVNRPVGFKAKGGLGDFLSRGQGCHALITRLCVYFCESHELPSQATIASLYALRDSTANGIA